jgi:hypothetical protein
MSERFRAAMRTTDTQLRCQDSGGAAMITLSMNPEELGA